MRQDKFSHTAWESETISSLIDTNRDNSPKFKAQASEDQYRFLLPEFYGAGCIKCHGTQEGQLGHEVHPTKIDRKLDDFAGAISIVINN